jgi:hypothetical protein
MVKSRRAGTPTPDRPANTSIAPLRSPFRKRGEFLFDIDRVIDRFDFQAEDESGVKPTSVRVGRRRRRHLAQELIAAVTFDRG